MLLTQGIRRLRFNTHAIIIAYTTQGDSIFTQMAYSNIFIKDKIK